MALVQMDRFCWCPNIEGRYGKNARINKDGIRETNHWGLHGSSIERKFKDSTDSHQGSCSCGLFAATFLKLYCGFLVLKAFFS